MEVDIEQITFDETGLIPAIIQDSKTGAILTLAYMNETALLKTIETKETWFFSRKRQQLWNKGETSGNNQLVKRITYDCDGDALLVLVEPQGPACHTGNETCFYQQLYENSTQQFDLIYQLAKTIKNRQKNPVDGSYTTYLFQEGIDKVLKKVGEEASEVIIGAKNPGTDELIWEIADLVYHTLVLMEIRDVTIENIREELYKRHLQKAGNENE
ncbi:bifunctional phosphoribosyl-AMP cyclohydrolase/phosphoribosyl-ATP diphosphatase HisIE [Lentibacillus sp. Marseille-P4043]|uniref:bifunctional phosphoribosyl-AMP cyclohydrolase/phosphoribosyl-ATP diphosphatase HisIE n=1 Tax=Lentibacillus sp. Marseille-P4043 TaxID=2040293 RepID=UPI000D0BC40D|nr:bifunctional phosphoribosyl-AMP cyclohydrolase/phosphoribosyl-ATP diphosphatase HisIE [Lentibacillus sp. Marseille-P4043]